MPEEFPYGAEPFVVGFLTIFLFFQVIWIFAYLHKRNDYADVAWGLGFPLGAWAAYAWTLFHQGRIEYDIRALLVLILTTIWGVRLFLHVGKRNLSHSKEDARYNKWRREWGDTWVWRSYLQVFVLQAVILFVIDLPLIWIVGSEAVPLDPLAILGLIIWIVGFVFEAVGDYQLKAFVSTPGNKGKFIETGLWKYSRHPNYFGEVALWWGIFLFTLAVPGGWCTILSPLAISFLILKVSGVTMLEDAMRSRPGFAEYERRISKFFPRPPKA